MMYGRAAILPYDVNPSITKLPTSNDYYSQLIRFLRQAKSSAWYKTKHQRNIYKRTYDTGRQDVLPAETRTTVFLKQIMPKHLQKFSPKFYGPFKVIKKNGRLNYEVKHVHDGHIEKVHTSRIRLIN